MNVDENQVIPQGRRSVSVQNQKLVLWELAEVTSPNLVAPVAVIAAKNIPCLRDANRRQNLNIYLPHTLANAKLVGSAVTALPAPHSQTGAPCYQVHIHGGAWRDPQLTAKSIEPTVAHAFAANDDSHPIIAIASINYTVSQFPTHPTLPYDAASANHADPAREAVHPQHLADVFHGLDLLRSFGLREQSYILSGHSCGACLALQAVLASPQHYGLQNLRDAPCPAALIGLNGLYDLVALVDGLGSSHQHLHDEYQTLLSNAFGTDKQKWEEASPALLNPASIAARVNETTAPRLFVLDQSQQDQLVPTNQRTRLEQNLHQVQGVRVVEGHRCTGPHAAPWEQGIMIWESLQDVLALLDETGAEDISAKAPDNAPS
ncbi:alpha/beta hydrolase [Massilia sp. CMS3.1]|uniref:alpha/beta hydrolase n=1 Tax=Massilia sp. CMS3.1 TaxID=3373083 RepID=UPI003EE4FDB3